MDLIDAFQLAFNTTVTQLAVWVPKLIVAYIIWWLGNKMLEGGLTLLSRVNIPNMTLDDHAIRLITRFARPVGKVVLFLVVLDYLEIGSSVVGAVANGITLTVAIALGLAFGRALEPEAANLVKQAKQQFETGPSTRRKL